MKQRLIVLAILAVVVMPVSVLSYTHDKTYPAAPTTTSSILANGNYLRNVLPEQVYQYTLDKIVRYRNADSPQTTSYTIKDNQVTIGARNYSLALVADDTGNTIPVIIKVLNYGNFYAITVTINGNVQDIN